MKNIRIVQILQTAFILLLLGGINNLAQIKAPEDTLIAGNWIGSLNFGAQQLRIVIKIKLTDSGYFKGTLDSPDQGAKDIPFDTVTLNSGKIKAASKMIGGVFEGTINMDSLIIRGEWKQGGTTLPLVMKKTNESVEAKRPQEPKRPFPYKEEEVTVENKIDNIKLAGTLTLPNQTGIFPAVVLITGSGAQDRDEMLMGHKPFLVISDYLTRNGIAVLRMDDRGIGKSTGDFAKATTFDFVNDISSAVEYLKSRADINKTQIGLIGHSEGGLIAPLVAVKTPDVSYITLLAGPGVPGNELLALQISAILRSGGIKEDVIEKNNLFMKTLFNVILQDADSATTAKRIDGVINEFINGLTEEEKKNPMNSEEGIRKQISTLTSPWFKTFLSYDPKPTLEKVKCPVLALNGTADLQVSSKQNLPPIKEALIKGGNNKFEIIELPKLNHLFQHAETGSISEYGKLEETISPEVLKIMADWIKKTINNK